MRVADISSVFSNHKYNLTLTCKTLDAWKGQHLKGRRTQVEYDLKKEGGKGIDLPFLQEVSQDLLLSVKNFNSSFTILNQFCNALCLKVTLLMFVTRGSIKKSFGSLVTWRIKHCSPRALF